MSFPSSPIDRQQATVNNIKYFYSTSAQAWTRVAMQSMSIAGTTSTFIVSNSSQSTSSNSGALQVTGGAGIGGSLYVANTSYIAGAEVITTASISNYAAANVVSTGTTGTFLISNVAASNSTNTGALQIVGGVGIGGNLYVGGNVYAANLTDPIVVNDISTQFNGVNTVFALKQDQTSINTIVDSKDLEVVINGARLTPYVKTLTYPWLTPYDSFKGFRVSGNNLIIYNAPAIGDSAAVIVRSISTSIQTRKYPYSATTIAFGD